MQLVMTSMTLSVTSCANPKCASSGLQPAFGQQFLERPSSTTVVHYTCWQHWFCQLDPDGPHVWSTPNSWGIFFQIVPLILRGEPKFIERTNGIFGIQTNVVPIRTYTPSVIRLETFKPHQSSRRIPPQPPSRIADQRPIPPRPLAH